MTATRAAALALDAADSLAFARARFALPPGIIYLDGNSLGPLPAAAPAHLARVIGEEWGQGLIRSWNDAGWIDLPARLGARIAPLIGAAPDEVIVADSVSVDLFKLAAAALALQAPRRIIVTEAGNFPTDTYMLEGLAALAGAELRIVPAGGLAAALDASTALLLLCHAHYKTGAVHDMAALTAAAHRAGALILWDLSHSAGALALDLAAANADFAVGCGYKYLNGGPGAPAFLFAARRHHHALRQPLTGWMGHAAPFGFEARYRPAAGMARLLTGTPPVLAMAGLEAGLATFDGVDIAACEAKSRALADLFLARAAARCPELVPLDPGTARRGAQLSLRHADAYAICQCLIAAGVIGDFRPPDLLRLGFPALYTRFADAFDAAEILADIMATSRWRAPEFAVRRAVT